MNDAAVVVGGGGLEVASGHDDVPAREVLARHGKSFRFAGALLSDAALDDAAVVYAFCRAVDDAVDEAEDVEHGRAEAAAFLRELDAPRRPVVRAFLEVARRRAMDTGFARELVKGVQSDAEAVVRIDGDASLLRYCYRVAGTVGGMMCAVLDVRDPRALPFAVDLGIGMQLTNICRDVLEDARMNRRYLPLERLRAADPTTKDCVVDSIDPDSADPLAEHIVARRAGVKHVVKDLLALAERYYQSGEQGLRFIPWRSRFGIFVAARVYRGIGRKLLRQGGDPLLGRVSTTKAEKIWIALGAALRFLFLPRSGDHDATLHETLRGLPGCAPDTN